MSATSEDVGEEGIELYNTKIRNINVLENLLNLQQCDTETQDNILNGMDTSVFEDYALYIDDGDEDTLPTYIFMGLASEDMSDEVQEELSSSVLSSLQNLTMVSGNNIPTSVCTTVRYVFVTASPECIDIGNKFTYMIGNIVDISSAEDMLNILTQSAS
jgi:hypothetical protein